VFANRIARCVKATKPAFMAILAVVAILFQPQIVSANDNSQNSIVYPRRSTAGLNPLIVSSWSGRPTGLEVRIRNVTTGVVLMDWTGLGNPEVEFRTKDLLGYDLPIGDVIRVSTRPRTSAQTWPVARVDFLVSYQETPISHSIGTEFRSKTATFFRTSEDKLGPTLIAPDDQVGPAVMGFRLSNYGILPGDYILITSDSEYDLNSDGSAKGTSLVAVFSSSSKILADHSLLARVPDAIDAGRDFVTPPTLRGNLPTDIPQDFLVPKEGVYIQVAERTEYIFFSHLDTFFSDNGLGHVTIDLVVLGDVNRDGVVNFLDISPFIVLLTSGEFQFEADLNQDGLVNFFDISLFIDALAN